MEFIHRKLIQDNDIDVNSLPIGVKQSIGTFNRLEKTFENKEDTEELENVKKSMEELSIEIAGKIKEFNSNEIVGDITESEKQEEIVASFYNNNMFKVSKEDLIKQGFPKNSSFPTSFKIGAYTLIKPMMYTYYKISKTS